MSENEGATAEVEEVAEQTAPSMEDTIRETLRGLQEKGAVVDDESTPVDDVEKAARIRDEKGKFAKDAAETPIVEPETVAAPAAVKAPNTWRKEAQEKFASADPVIQAEIEKRETEFHKGIEQYKAAANFAQSIERAIAPYAATLQSQNVTPERAINELLAADHRLRYGSPQEKANYMQVLAQTYGVDMSLAQSQEQRYVDPNVSAMQQRVQQLEGYLQQQQLLGQQQEQQTLNSEIAAFAADPSHSHFESVRGHMAALLQAGQAKDLADAYEQAVYANPVTRAEMLKQQAEAMRKENALKAQQAKAVASVNVRARPSMPTSQPIGPMDDTIRATLRRLQSA